MRHRLCASTAILAGLLASALPAAGGAADLSVAPIYKAPPPPPISTWNGSYVGVSGGGTWGSAVVRNDLIGADQTPRIDLGGGIVGITSGFNVHNGGIVLGIESDTSASGKSGSASQFPPTAAFSTEVKERWLSTLRGRVGYAQSNWLLYATAGGALASLENSVTGPPGTISDQHWHWGWTVGGGVEVKLTPDWSAKVEYLYVGLQDKTYFNPAPSALFPSSQRTHLDDHILRVGVNYRLPWSILDTFFKR